MLSFYYLYPAIVLALSLAAAPSDDDHHWLNVDAGQTVEHELPTSLESRSLDTELNLRDVFGKNTSGREFLGTEYTKLNPKDLSICPDERFLRVASSHRFNGMSEWDWIHQWAKTNIPYLSGKSGMAFAQELFDFAYELRFGPDSVPEPLIRLAMNFDTDFRKDHNLDTKRGLLPVCSTDYLVTSADDNFTPVVTSTDSSVARMFPHFNRSPTSLHRSEATRVSSRSYSNIRPPRVVPQSINLAYLSALLLAELGLTRTLERAKWTTLKKAGLPRLAWPLPTETRG